MKRNPMADPSHPRNRNTVDAMGSLVCLLLLQWRSPPGELRDRLTQGVRQLRANLYETAADAGLDGKGMERLARRAFVEIKTETEALN